MLCLDFMQWGIPLEQRPTSTRIAIALGKTAPHGMSLLSVLVLGLWENFKNPLHMFALHDTKT